MLIQFTFAHSHEMVIFIKIYFLIKYYIVTEKKEGIQNYLNKISSSWMNWMHCLIWMFLLDVNMCSVKNYTMVILSGIICFFYVSLLVRLFFLMAIPKAYEHSWAWDWIRAAAATYATAVATPDPLNHCTRSKIELVPPQWPEPLQSDFFFFFLSFFFLGPHWQPM